jgi:predicted transcriptional regulator of viral defense system
MNGEFALGGAIRTQTRTHPWDQAVGELAGRQHGVVARQQLLALGFGRDQIGRRIRLGRLIRLDAGVYAVGHSAQTQGGFWMAAVLGCGPGAVLSHHSAAALWGIGNGRELIHVTAPRRGQSRTAVDRHFARLPGDERTALDGIPVTTPPRTVLDLAATADVHTVEIALRNIEFHRLRDRLSVPALLQRYPGHRGAGTIRIALARQSADPGGRTRSPLEDLFLPFLDRFDPPRPRLNFHIHLGEKRYEADCFWPAQRVIVELDGFAAHGTRRAFRDDRARDRRLIAAGYRVTRISQDQLEEEPTEVAADLRATLSDQRQSLAIPPPP